MIEFVIMIGDDQHDHDVSGGDPSSGLLGPLHVSAAKRSGSWVGFLNNFAVHFSSYFHSPKLASGWSHDNQA